MKAWKWSASTSILTSPVWMSDRAAGQHCRTRRCISSISVGRSRLALPWNWSRICGVSTLLPSRLVMSALAASPLPPEGVFCACTEHKKGVGGRMAHRRTARCEDGVESTTHHCFPSSPSPRSATLPPPWPVAR
eukprot:scaffold3777_cov123-Isochrysis_galbana.AAC.1